MEISDPIEVYNMFIVEDDESKDSNKQNARFHKRLIRHVRRQRVLYDPKHKQFSCAAAKNEVWAKIAKRMGCDGMYIDAYIHAYTCMYKDIYVMYNFAYIRRDMSRSNLIANKLIFACVFVFQLISARMLG